LKTFSKVKENDRKTHIVELEIERKHFKSGNRRRGRNQNGHPKREICVEAKGRIEELLQRATRSRTFGLDDKTQ